MKTVKFSFLFLCMLLGMTACKKEKTDEAYYYGKWNVTENMYSSIDTSYTDAITPGTQTFEFYDNHTVRIRQVGIADFTDTWKLLNADSVDFGTQPTWFVTDKEKNRFKARFYMNSNATMSIKLER